MELLGGSLDRRLAHKSIRPFWLVNPAGVMDPRNTNCLTYVEFAHYQMDNL